jgi:AmmeMemoRadiSam system protein A
MTSEADRKLLLQLARAAVTAFATRLPVPAVPASPATDRRAGVFVSLHKHDDLRGCIGHVEADHPLGLLVVRCAVSAASADPRFPAVAASELDELHIELSILGPLERISGVDQVEIGRHGLVVEHGWRRGLLLPQVATDWELDAETFVAQTCHKAGLAPDAWKEEATLWRFEAEVFGERGKGG